MIVGYGIFGQDNGVTLFPNGHGKSVCEVWDFIENRHEYLTSDFSLKRTDLSLSYTYDSALIVNQKFRDFCLRNKYDGLSFYPVPAQEAFYLLIVNNKVEFDTKRRKTKFEQLEKSCGKFNAIAGATPICLNLIEPLLDGIYRTDVEFGTGYEQSPIIIIGPETYSKMQKEKFNDIDYEKILDSYDWEK